MWFLLLGAVLAQRPVLYPSVLSQRQVNLTWTIPSQQLVAGSTFAVQISADARRVYTYITLQYPVNVGRNGVVLDMPTVLGANYVQGPYYFTGILSNPYPIYSDTVPFTGLYLVTPATPPTLFAVTVSTQQSMSVSVSFGPPADTGGRPIVAYDLQASNTNQFINATAGVLYTSPTIVNMGASSGSPNRIFYFRLRARNDGNLPGQWTDPVSLQLATPPSAVQWVALTPLNSTAFLVSFTPPKDNGGLPVTSYTLVAVDVVTNLQISTTIAVGSVGTSALNGALTAPFTNLICGRTYSIGVSATNDKGTSTLSPTATTSLVYSPGAVQNFVVQQQPDRTILFTWDPPLSDGCLTITGYILRGATSSDPNDPTAPVFTLQIDPSLRSQSIRSDGLVVGVRYWFFLSAGNTFQSPYGPPTVGPPGGLILANTPGVATIQSLVVISSTSLNVSWSLPPDNGAPLLSQLLYYSKSTPITSVAPSITLPATTTWRVLTNLTTGGTYWLALVARNSMGSGAAAWSPAIVIVTVPSLCTNPSAVVGNGSATYSWTPPADNGGLPLQYWTVYLQSLDGTIRKSYSIQTTNSPPNPSFTTLRVQDVPIGTYLWNVTASNSRGESSPTSPLRVIYDMPAVPPSRVVAAVKPTDPTAALLTLSFTTPPSNIIGFAVLWTTAQRAGTVIVNDPSIPVEIDGLTTGLWHFFQVAVINAFGVSAYSPPSDSILIALKPSAPLNFNVAKKDAQTALLSWSPPLSNGGSPILDYSLEYSSNPSFSPVAKVPFVGANQTSTTLTVSQGSFNYYRLAAENFVGKGDYANTSIFFDNPPPPPSGVVVTMDSAISATVRWSPPVTSPRCPSNFAVVYWDTAPILSRQTQFQSTTSNSLTLANQLMLGTRYYFWVIFNSACGLSDSSAVTSLLFVWKSDPPQNLLAVLQRPSSVVVTWTPPVFTGGVSLSNYVLDILDGDLTEIQQSPVGVGNSPTAAVSGLILGNVYAFRVAANNSAGLSDWTSPVPLTIAFPPVAPRSVTAVAQSATSALVSWQPPLDDGGRPVSSYIINYNAVAAGNPDGSISTDDGLQNSIVVSSLVPGALYLFSVVATNDLGSGAPSNTSVPVLIGVTPAAPLDVTWKPEWTVQNASFRLTWRPPASNGGLVITSYTINTLEGLAQTITQSMTVPSATRSVLMTSGLRVGNQYSFSVSATNTIGTGPAAPSKPNSTTLVWIPSAPDLSSVWVTAATTFSLSATSSASTGGSPILMYRVYYQVGNNAPASQNQTFMTSPFTASVDGLASGATYSVWVTLVNAQGESPPSQVKTVTLVYLPDRPSSVRHVPLSSSSVTLTWDPPSSTGGVPIAFFELDIWASATGTPDGNGPRTLSVNTTGAPTSYTLTGLVAGQYYLVDVSAWNTRFLQSPPSSPYTFQLTYLPGGPRSVSVIALSSSEAQVSFSAPTDTGGLPILSYITVFSSRLGTSSLVSGSSPAFVRGLQAGLSYTFSVAAQNARGQGSTSMGVNFTLLWAPAAPSSVSGVVVNRTILQCSWSAPTDTGGLPISQYNVELWENGVTQRVQAINLSGLMTLFYNLDQGQSYSCRVRAQNSFDYSAFSQLSTSMEIVSPPTAPNAFFVIVRSSTSASASWAVPTDLGGLPLLSYLLSYRPMPSGDETVVTVSGDTLSNTITGLTPGLTYSFSVKARNAAGMSPSSPALVRDLVWVPSAPMNVTLQRAISPLQISVDAAWMPPTDTGGQDIFKYDIGWTIGSAPTGDPTQFVTSIPASQTSYTSSSLPTDQQLYFQVRAWNSAGAGPWRTSSPILLAIPPTAPTLQLATLNPGILNVTVVCPTFGGAAVTPSVTLQDTTLQGTAIQAPSTTSSWVVFQDLTRGHEYQVSAKCSNVAGDSNWTSTVSVLAFPPSPPTFVVTVSRSSVSVTWTAPTDNGGSAVTAYHLYWTAGGAPVEVNFDPTTLQANINSLSPGSQYNIWVTAENVAGESEAVPQQVRLLVLPGAPTNCVARAMSSTVLNVSCIPPADTGNSLALKYYINVSQSFQNTPTTISCAALSGCIVPGLSTGAEYSVVAFAINEIGSGPGSDPTYTTLLTTPGPPRQVNVTPDDWTNNFLVMWQPPLDTGGQTLTQYQLQICDRLTFDGPRLVAFSVNVGTVYTAMNISTGVSYYVRLRAANPMGFGPWSSLATSTDPFSQNPPILMVFRPSPPLNVTASIVGDPPSIKLNWLPPTQTGGAAIAYYAVTVREVMDNFQADYFYPASTSLRFSSLPNGGDPPIPLALGQSYSVKVQARNVAMKLDSFSLSSPEILIPFIVTPYAPTVRVSLNSSTTAFVQVIPSIAYGGSPNTGFAVMYGTATGSPNTVTSATSTFTITGLSEGMTYSFQGSVTNKVGVSPLSSQVQVLAVYTPSQPTSVVATAASETSLQVTWGLPTALGGLPPLNYIVQISSPGNSFNITTSNSPVTIPNLVSGSTVTATVAAVNFAGVGVWASPTNTLIATLPGAPQNAICIPVAVDTLGFTWNIPSDDGGSPITGYLALISLFNTEIQRSLITSHTSSNYSVQFSGLKSGINYAVSVVAQSAKGQGSWSNSTVYLGFTPNPPTNVRVVAVDATTVNVTFENGNLGGGTALGYDIFCLDANLNLFTQQSSLARSLTFALPTATKYSIQVAVRTSYGSSARSAITPLSTVWLGASQSFPVGVNAVAMSSSSALVSWDVGNSTVSITAVNIEYSTSPTFDSIDGTLVAPPSATSSQLVPGLSVTMTYYFKVAWTTWQGIGQYSLSSPPVIIVSVPNAPLNPAASPASSRSVGVSWTAPQDNGGYSVIDYQVVVSCAGQVQQSTVSSTPSLIVQTVVSLSDACEGGFVNVSIAARNNVGLGAPVTVQTKLVFASGAAGAVAVVPVSLSQFQISWTAPQDTGGVPPMALSYIVTWAQGQYRQLSTTTTATYAYTPDLIGQWVDFQVITNNSVALSLPAQTTQLLVSVPIPAKWVQAEVVDSIHVKITWDIPPTPPSLPVIGAAIAQSSDGGLSFPLQWDVAANRSWVLAYDFSQQGKTFQYAVQLRNSQGLAVRSPPSNPITLVSRPNAPVIRNAYPINNSALRLVWDMPTDTGGLQLTRCRACALTTTTLINVDSLTLPPMCPSVDAPTSSAVISNLAIGPYQFVVSCKNANFTGPYSQPYSYSLAFTPNAPQNITASVVAADSVMLKWIAPSDNGQSILRYDISYTILDRSSTPVTVSAAATTPIDPSSLMPSVTVMKLSAGYSYQFTITAVNSLGSGPSSQSPVILLVYVPSPPSNVLLEVVNSTSIRATWLPPDSDGGSAVLSYVVYLSSLPTPSTSTSPTSTPAANPVPTPIGSFETSNPVLLMTNLVAGTMYGVGVVAINAQGSSLPSAPATKLLIFNPAAPGEIRAVVDGRDAAIVSWQPPTDNGGRTITGYTVYYSTDSGSGDFSTTDSGVLSATTNTNQVRVAGLVGGLTYLFKVSAISQDGSTGDLSVAGPPGGLLVIVSPDAPLILGVDNLGSSSVRIQWAAPLFTGYSPVTDYTVKFTLQSNSSSFVTQDVPGSCTVCSADINGLLGGVTYVFSVVANNARLSSAPSSTITSLIASVPEAPSPVLAVAVPPASVKISWGAPQDNFSPILQYGLMYQAYQGAVTSTAVYLTYDPTTLHPVNGLVSVMVSNLTRQVMYSFQIFAINAVGRGKDATVFVSTIFPPDAPTGVSVTSASRTSISVQWNRPYTDGVDPVTDYTINLIDQNAVARVVSAVSFLGTPSQVIPDVNPGLWYNVSVSATSVFLSTTYKGKDSTPISYFFDYVPAPPSFIQVSLLDPAAPNLQAVVAWRFVNTAPQTGGLPVTNYTIQTLVVTAANPTPTQQVYVVTAADFGKDRTSVTLPVLPGNTYRFTIFSTNAAGTGEASDAYDLVVPKLAPASSVQAFSIQEYNATSLQATWQVSPCSDPSCALANITLCHSIDTSDNSTDTTTVGIDQICVSLSPSLTSTLITDLTPGYNYILSLTALFASGVYSSPKRTAYFLEWEPGPMYLDSVLATSEMSATLQWTWPDPASLAYRTLTGGSSLTYVDVHYSKQPVPNAAEHVYQVFATQHSTTISVFPDGPGLYYFALSLENSCCGKGPVGPWVTVQVNASSSSINGQPPATRTVEMLTLQSTMKLDAASVKNETFREETASKIRLDWTKLMGLAKPNHVTVAQIGGYKWSLLAINESVTMNWGVLPPIDLDDMTDKPAALAVAYWLAEFAKFLKGSPSAFSDLPTTPMLAAAPTTYVGPQLIDVFLCNDSKSYAVREEECPPIPIKTGPVGPTATPIPGVLSWKSVLGLVVGCVVGTLLVVICIAYFLRKHYWHKKEEKKVQEASRSDKAPVIVSPEEENIIVEDDRDRAMGVRFNNQPVLMHTTHDNNGIGNTGTHYPGNGVPAAQVQGGSLSAVQARNFNMYRDDDFAPAGSAPPGGVRMHLYPTYSQVDHSDPSDGNGLPLMHYDVPNTMGPGGTVQPTFTTDPYLSSDRDTSRSSGPFLISPRMHVLPQRPSSSQGNVELGALPRPSPAGAVGGNVYGVTAGSIPSHVAYHDDPYSGIRGTTRPAWRGESAPSTLGGEMFNQRYGATLDQGKTLEVPVEHEDDGAPVLRLHGIQNSVSRGPVVYGGARGSYQPGRPLR